MTERQLLTGQVYDILPDEETWGVTMHTVRFPERPTAITAALNTASRPTDQLLNNCLIRGLKAEDGSTVFEFYMPENLQEPDAFGSLEPVSQEVEERAETLLKPMDNDAFAQEIPVSDSSWRSAQHKAGRSKAAALLAALCTC